MAKKIKNLEHLDYTYLISTQPKSKQKEQNSNGRSSAGVINEKT
jgi:hypothetical protein